MEEKPVRSWTRAELEAYLEGRGFAVYSDESIDKLREAVRLDMVTGEGE